MPCHLNVCLGMVKFGSYAQVEFYLNEYPKKQALLNKINVRSIRRLDDETNIAGALRVMRERVFTNAGDRDWVQDIGMHLFLYVIHKNIVYVFLPVF